MDESCGEKPGLEMDLVRSGKKQRKENDEEGSSERKAKSDSVTSITNGVSVDQKVKVESQQTIPSPERVSSHELAIYPGCGWSDCDESKIISVAEPSKRKSMDLDCFEEKEVEAAKSKHKENTMSNINIEIIELSDSDEEPTMDIPIEVSRRPPSRYKDKLIEELKRPFDECEYKELMNKSTLRTKRIVYKDLRPMENEVKAEATPRIRVRAIKTEEDNKSFFDWYPGLERKVKMATRGRRLSLLRGFFFWLQNSSQEQSFKPWHRGDKGSKTQHRNNSVTPK